MSAIKISNCITRVIVDGDRDLELAELQSVMQRIQQSLPHLPASQCGYIGNALLNLAVCHMLRDTNDQHTATKLLRVADAVLEQEQSTANACVGGRQ